MLTRTGCEKAGESASRKGAETGKRPRHGVMQLQRGNHAFGELFPSSGLTTPAPRSTLGLAWPIRPKLEIGPVDDPLEREADRNADRVMQHSESVLPRLGRMLAELEAVRGDSGVEWYIG
jgi:hypothetical protein